MPTEFIQLNRTFHPLSEKVEGDDSDIRQLIGIGKPIGWPDLLRRRRVVILSEAGSGKTFEIRHAAQELRKEGKPAFFLRLEHIGEDFESAFEEGSHEEFKAWLDGSDEAWLLLDSIDEARLRDPLDFTKAIRILGHRLGAAKQRAHIVLSGRSSAWRPKSDLFFCSQHLSYVESKAEGATRESDIDDDYADRRGLTAQENQPFSVVALDDLRADQIEKFAQAKGAKDTRALLDAVERADAWSFTARPQDLEELVAFWNDAERIGSRLELMQTSIQQRLEERSQDRSDARPISAERIRAGARLVAAACTLAREPTIRVPDGQDNGKGLAIRSILADWDDDDCAALLSRPIFDEAIYGTVRFHHRTVREYLTAEWCAKLLQQQTSRRRIEALLFRQQYDTEVVVPSMRPVLAWLVLLDEAIRERTRALAPEVFFEGGDPSRLPIDTRRQILIQVCEKLAAGTSTRSVQDYSAVQRFAAEDLTEDVVELIEAHGSDEELLWFLLRMVWQGQMKGALPQAKAVALSSTAGKYVRRAAFRAVAAIGTPSDMAEVRASFVNEAPTLNREWIAELLSATRPTVETIDWLFACFDKAEQPRPHRHDSLIDETTSFVERMERQLLMVFIEKATELLDRPPVIERWHCEISQRYAWILRPAGAAVHRLVTERDPAAQGRASLEVLHKLPLGRDYGLMNRKEDEFEFRNLVPEWIDLKFALFWHLVAHERRRLRREKWERLTNWWNAYIYDSYVRPFRPEDFVVALKAVAERDLDDDKQVALTLAFAIYTDNGRPAPWRRMLKQAVKGDSELEARLTSLFRPAPAPAAVRSDRRQVAGWTRRHKRREAAAAKNEERWRAAMRANPDTVRAPKLSNPDDISNWQWWLYNAMREKPADTRSAGNWESLKREFGEDVARAFRDGAVNFWRRHHPKLRSEGAEANRIAGNTIFGLTGLSIEARETENWPNDLSEPEAELAFRYAMYELNGFPHWMPKLFEAFTSVVLRMALAEIDYELSIEEDDQETHYLLSNVNWSGDWLWNTIGPQLLARLSMREPRNRRTLRYLLNIINRASAVSDHDIARLAARKRNSIRQPDHLAAWYATWVGVAPAEAIPTLDSYLGSMGSGERQTAFAMDFVTCLMGSRNLDSTWVRDHFRTPQYLRHLYLLMHRYIRQSEDIDRAGGGAYSPGPRDDAQDGRNNLFALLKEVPGKEAYLAVVEIAAEHPDPGSRPWFVLHAKTKAEADSEGDPWTAEQVRDFTLKLERTPANHRDLFELAVMRIEDLKASLEDGDSSIAGILRHVTDELDMRKYIGGWCRDHANGRYSIPQEEELADAKRPDIRFHGARFDSPVPGELKLADNWTGPKLFERLETQLCGDYLRDFRSGRGLFVLVYRGEKKSWELPDGKRNVDFSGLVSALQARWTEISGRFGNVDEIRVIGIDLTKRGKAPEPSRPARTLVSTLTGRGDKLGHCSR